MAQLQQAESTARAGEGAGRASRADVARPRRTRRRRSSTSPGHPAGRSAARSASRSWVTAGAGQSGESGLAEGRRASLANAQAGYAGSGGHAQARAVLDNAQLNHSWRRCSPRSPASPGSRARTSRPDQRQHGSHHGLAGRPDLRPVPVSEQEYLRLRQRGPLLGVTARGRTTSELTLADGATYPIGNGREILDRAVGATTGLSASGACSRTRAISCAPASTRRCAPSST